MDTFAALLVSAKLKNTKTWRNLLLPLTIRYDQLHVLLQLAFGWQNDYFYTFRTSAENSKQYMPASYEAMGVTEELNPSEYAEQNYLYPDLTAGPVDYEYAFDEGYSIALTLKQTVTFAELKGRNLPFCTGGRGSNPPNELTIEQSDSGAESEVFHRNRLNRVFALWTRAGDQMILADGDDLDDIDLDNGGS